MIAKRHNRFICIYTYFSIVENRLKLKNISVQHMYFLKMVLIFTSYTPTQTDWYTHTRTDSIEPSGDDGECLMGSCCRHCHHRRPSYPLPSSSLLLQNIAQSYFRYILSIIFEALRRGVWEGGVTAGWNNMSEKAQQYVCVCAYQRVCCCYAKRTDRACFRLCVNVLQPLADQFFFLTRNISQCAAYISNPCVSFYFLWNIWHERTSSASKMK